jgi:hypothetical protein
VQRTHKYSGILVPRIRGDDESLRGDDAVKPGNDDDLLPPELPLQFDLGALQPFALRLG